MELHRLQEEKKSIRPSYYIAYPNNKRVMVMGVLLQSQLLLINESQNKGFDFHHHPLPIHNLGVCTGTELVRTSTH